MKEKKKLIITTVIVLVMMIATIGLTYAMFIYNATGENSKLVLGDIWMKYTEKEGISLQNALPGDPYSEYFEFTITGTNTYEDKDIWYDVILSNGDVPDDKLEENRIDSKYLKFKLVEVNGEEETVIFTDRSYNDLNNRRVYVSTIPKNTTGEYNKIYRMYMTLSEKLEIGNTSTSVMTMEDFENVFASVKVSVTGDFNTKQMPGTMARLGLSAKEKFWVDDIESVKSNIKEVNFIQLGNNEIDVRYNAASIKSDVTTVVEFPIKAWLEPVESNSTKYIMYVASEEEIYFPSDIFAMFANFSNLESINFDNIDTSQVSSMIATFYNCSSLNSLNFENWNTSNVTTTLNSFYGCSGLTELDLSSFDTSNITTMMRMFYNCNSLTDLDLSDWNVENVTNFNSMFMYCKNLTNLDLENWNTINATDMGSMFAGCYILTGIKGIENFNTNQVKSFNAMFSSCRNLTNLDLNSWNTINVTNMAVMFSGCSNLKTLDLSSWDTRNTATAGSMFADCSKLEEVKGIENFNTNSMTRTDFMFSNCKSLTSLDLSSWDMSKVTNDISMFNQVSKATEIKLPDKVKRIDDFMFNHNYAVTGDIFTIPKSVTTIGKTHMWYGYGTTFKEFVVESGNTNFKTIDGVLYTMDGTRLISIPTKKTFTDNTLELPEGLTFINESSFGLNKNINTLVLPNSYVITRYVGKSNASYNKNNVNYGNSLSIGIYYRTNIGSYEVKSDNPNYTSVDGCIYSKDGSELIAVPWQYNGALSIKEGTTKIGQEAFWTQGASSSETTKLTSVHIPASVTTIESSQLTALNKLVGRITITIDEANPNYTISSGKIVSK